MEPEPDVGRPLDGLRVVALEHAVAAPLCTRHLADLGAEVIKVERPGGDFARRYDSAVNGGSTYFVWLNYGKRSVVLDLSQEAGRRAFERLLATADVVVHNLGPGALDRLGFGWPRLHERWPALIGCSISGFGPDGPYGDRKAYDLILQGESGLLAVTGTPDAPARVGVSIADICAGTYALSAILAALIERDRTGRGRLLEVSMLDGLAEWMSVPALLARYRGEPPRTGLRHASIAPYGPYPTADGEAVMIGVQTDAQWRRFCELVLRRPPLARDPRFASNERRVGARAELDGLIEAALAGLTRAELLRRLDAADVPSGSLNRVQDLLDHPQLRARGRWLEVATPHGPATVARSVLGDGAARQVPDLGADTEAVLGELDPASAS